MKLQLERFLTRLRAAKNYSPHTLRAYRADLESFAAKFPDLAAADLDRVHVRRHLAELQSGTASRATVLRKASALRSFVKFLRAEGELKRDPFLGVPLPKRARSLPKFLTEAEMEEILSAPTSAGDTGSQRDRAMIELLYSSGLRRTEVSTLNIGDIDILSGTIRVFGKGSKERIVPVGKEALTRLRDYLRFRGGPADGEPLFANLRGARLSSEGVAFVVRRWVKRSSLLKKVTPHVFRHSFATHLLNRGCNIREVQEMLGHADLNTTQIYTHVSLQKLQDVYKSAHPRGA
ncbi:MAG TPA: site-specific tyrosine recombinase/integron integrase [Elusimicrobiota bacterium]|jgi:tyrosine recombinase XerC|nr:site-specific tyrosine recombinase/integron integrase [Elusimicrobiota bacterium]